MRASTIPALALAFGVTAVAGPARAHEIKAGAILIEHPWARATTAAQKNGAAYMIIRNGGEAPERLLGARSIEAESAGLHGTTITTDGVARMRSAEAVEIPPGGEVRLTPGGVHLMLAGLKGPLFEGISFPMTLLFERAGEIAIEVEVMGHGPQPGTHGGGPDAAGSVTDDGPHGSQAEGGHGAQHGN